MDTPFWENMFECIDGRHLLKDEFQPWSLVIKWIKFDLAFKYVYGKFWSSFEPIW